MKREYPNGYWPKIDYWLTNLSQYRVEQNPIKINLALTKLQYFMGREMNKSNTIAGVDFTQQLLELDEI
jgi:hypothetical protein